MGPSLTATAVADGRSGSRVRTWAPVRIVSATAGSGRAPRVLQQYERVAALLLDAGFAREMVMPIITGLDNIVLGSALDMSAPEEMWVVGEGVDAPRLALAQSATGADRSGQAFELALSGFLARCQELLEDVGPVGPAAHG